MSSTQHESVRTRSASLKTEVHPVVPMRLPCLTIVSNPTPCPHGSPTSSPQPVSVSRARRAPQPDRAEQQGDQSDKWGNDSALDVASDEWPPGRTEFDTAMKSARRTDLAAR